MNHVTLMGRLTRDPELKYSQAGKAYCRFTVAINREFNREEADFINCLAFGKTAETIAEWLEKGRRIALHGRIQTGNYENKNGDKVNTLKTRMEIKSTHLKLLQINLNLLTVLEVKQAKINLTAIMMMS